MTDRSMAPSRALISCIFLFAIAIAHESCSSGSRRAEAAWPNSAREIKGDCPLTHRTLLVQIFGDALCPVPFRKHAT